MASNKRHERTRARRMALQVLYTGAITGESPTAVAESGRYLDEDGELSNYALMLIRGCEAHRAYLTRQLNATAENWSVSRMPIVDLAILRIGAYEMLFVDEVPNSVAINEAVELAKAYGAEDESPRFVNGVLGKIARSIDAGESLFPKPGSASDPGEAADEAASADSAAEEAPAAEDAAAAPVEPAPEGDATEVTVKAADERLVEDDEEAAVYES
ncbi:transcription antitermination factor NusB [Xiamenia xianingshaonis]|uniref:Transcription antitermination protein NusB n=1 Tax=Xiamenia xianingshaonis TaxID=2682776 RepID=A0A9E6MRE5_9ACTN|nr:transcription antitermination factor NusB [Xiamenia xianingshaonis]NHM13306.1 transcription antitermination factor NusB [Xiamenia xianingshaonis]QTU84612.1 transcription antitermination factor NusB [Xiamenia xianingshaonis]